MRHRLRACMDDTESSDQLNVPVYLLLQSRGSDMYAGTFLHITVEMYPTVSISYIVDIMCTCIIINVVTEPNQWEVFPAENWYLNIVHWFIQTTTGNASSIYKWQGLSYVLFYWTVYLCSVNYLCISCVSMFVLVTRV